MRIAIFQVPSSKSECEVTAAVRRAGMEPIECSWHESREKGHELDGYIFVGSFTNMPAEINIPEPIFREVKSQAEKGKPILGIGSGARILVESGLVPGIEDNKVAMGLVEKKLLPNDVGLHLCLSVHYQRNAFTRYLNQKSILHMPVENRESGFMISNMLLLEIEAQGLNVLQYCHLNGIIDKGDLDDFNGAVNSIAAVSNKMGNVMAVLPHIELANEGDAIFRSIRDYIAEGRVTQTIPLLYYPRGSR
jgi:phosphoribosylformylglycinamidine synthase subunit PurQ / glutaminase